MEQLKGFVTCSLRISVCNKIRLDHKHFTHRTNDMIRLFTSGVQRAAAQWCSHGGLWLPVVVLDDDLVALHQSLTNKLLKHLRSTHHWSFILSPEKVRKKAVSSVITVSAKACCCGRNLYPADGLAHSWLYFPFGQRLCYCFGLALVYAPQRFG